MWREKYSQKCGSVFCLKNIVIVIWPWLLISFLFLFGCFHVTLQYYKEPIVQNWGAGQLRILPKCRLSCLVLRTKVQLFSHKGLRQDGVQELWQDSTTKMHNTGQQKDSQPRRKIVCLWQLCESNQNQILIKIHNHFHFGYFFVNSFSPACQTKGVAKWNGRFFIHYAQNLVLMNVSTQKSEQDWLRGAQSSLHGQLK